MRILIDAHVFDHNPQGTRTYLFGLYNSLIPMARHIDFYLAARNIHQLKIEFGTNHKNLFFVEYSSENKYHRLLFELPRIIKKYKIDYAHYQYISPIVKLCKEIVTTHDILFNDFPEYFPKSYRFKNNFLFKRSAKRADLLLTVSEYSKQQIAKHYKINPDNIVITPNGIENCFFEAKHNEELPDIRVKYNIKSKYLLCISRIEPRKNHISLIKAYVELKLYNKGYDLILVGKEDIKSDLMYTYLKSIDKKIRDKIKFFSNIDNLEKLSFLKEASLFVYPSFAEGFGIPPLESLAVGTPTLCSNKTAMADFYFFKILHFCPENLEELKEKVNDILENKNTDISDKRDYIKAHYSWDTIAKSYLDILNKQINL